MKICYGVWPYSNGGIQGPPEGRCGRGRPVHLVRMTLAGIPWDDWQCSLSDAVVHCLPRRPRRLPHRSPGLPSGGGLVYLELSMERWFRCGGAGCGSSLQLKSTHQRTSGSGKPRTSHHLCGAWLSMPPAAETTQLRTRINVRMDKMAKFTLQSCWILGLGVCWAIQSLLLFIHSCPEVLCQGGN